MYISYHLDVLTPVILISTQKRFYFHPHKERKKLDPCVKYPAPSHKDTTHSLAPILSCVALNKSPKHTGSYFVSKYVLYTYFFILLLGQQSKSLLWLAV